MAVVKSNYGKHSFDNILKMNFPSVGQYDTPQILRNSFDGCSEWLPFNYLKSCRNDIKKSRGLHFFVDDYQFARVWTTPDRYADALLPFAAVCSPDFSIYADMPLALQLYNHYRKHWLGAYWQLHGVNVIPTVAWGTPDTYRWCFDGEPTHTTVAVSSIGCMKAHDSRQLFVWGYHEMIARLQPEQVLFVGQVPEELMELAPIIEIAAFSSKFGGRE